MPSKNPSVSIQKSNYENIDIGSLLKPIGGIKKYVKKGERVLLKTNLLTATEPEKVVVTNPRVVGAVAKEVQKAGATPIIGDSPIGLFNKRKLKKVYKKSGLMDLSKELGIELNYDTSCKKISVPNGEKLKKTRIGNYVLKSDKIISLPKLKTHYYMILTLATKIMFGAVPGLHKAKYHSLYPRKKDFSDMLLDVLSVATPNLVIMDGITAMEGDGPIDGNPVDIGLLFASNDSVALDLSVCKILDINPEIIPILKQAKTRNMYPEKINYPLLTPEEVKFKDFKLPESGTILLTGRKEPSRYPHMTDRCTACGECVQVCPRNAIKIRDKRARVDYEKCIKCYCCHETCRYSAIELK